MRIKKMLKHQGLFLQSPLLYPIYRWFMLVAGYGAGKTSSLAMTVMFFVKMLQGKKDRENHNARVLLGGINLGHLEKTTVSYIKEDLDASGTLYYHDKKNNIIKVGTVSIMLVSLSEPQKITGFDVVISFLDEVDDLGNLTQADDLTFEAIKACNERTRQMVKDFRKPFLMMASTSQGQKGLYRVYIQFIKSQTGFILIRGRTADNPYLDPSYVRSLYKIYTPEERSVFLEGKFLALAAGRIIGSFDWNLHYVDDDLDLEVLGDEVLYWAQDFNSGYNRGCVGVLREGRIWIVKSYDFPDIQHAPGVVRTDFPFQKIYFIPDASATEQVTQLKREMKKHGIYWVSRKKNPNVEDSVFLVNKLLYTKRMFVGKMAKDVAEAMMLGQRDKNGKVPKGIGPLSQVHYIDGVRMMAYYLASNKASLRDIRRVTIARHQVIEQNEGDIQDELDGYQTVAPGAM